MRSKIAVLYNEPETSRYDQAGEFQAVVGVLEAVNAVHKALLELGHRVIRVPLLPPESQLRGTIECLSVDLIFNLFEGFCGLPDTEALVPEIADDLGLKYTGCPAPALRLALDKARTKSALIGSGIDTPRFQVLRPDTSGGFSLRFPCIVKPVAEDASHGLTEESVVRDRTALQRQIERISGLYGGEALVEEFIDGREYNATVMGGKEPYALPVSEIVYTLPPEMPPILTYAAKWQPGTVYFTATNNVCPAPVSPAEQEIITRAALAAFRLIVGSRGYARVDMRQGRDGKLYILEVNPNPDISPGAGAVRQAQARGLSYTDFIGSIVELALTDRP